HYTDESRILRDKYMEYGLLPPKYIDDAGHVAIASVAGAHYLVSWNFEHLVKIRTKRLVGLINAMYGYSPIELVSPYEFGGGE
ncbi:MAG: hypothetical protein K6T39_10165, partial [Anoxybacillus ayderensis]|nr:hypothetical protein [Anoxybacillus ayderensis]